MAWGLLKLGVVWTGGGCFSPNTAKRIEGAGMRPAYSISLVRLVPSRVPRLLHIPMPVQDRSLQRVSRRGVAWTLPLRLYIQEARFSEARRDLDKLRRQQVFFLCFLFLLNIVCVCMLVHEYARACLCAA